jgi:anti-sigma B factor antagonist
MARTDSSSVTVARRGRVEFAGDADRTVVWLEGEHDVSTVAALSETVARAIALDDADLVVDLSGVQFMAGASVGVIIRACEFLRLLSRSLALRSPSPCVRRVLEVCGLLDLLDLRPIDETRMTGTAGRLATWVAIPAPDRLDRRADAPAPKPSSAPDPVRVGRVAAVRRESSVVGHLPVEKRTTTVAGYGGP